MTIAFISDLHLSADRPSSLTLFSDFMEKSGRLLDSLYILGDLFDYWIGDDASNALGFESVERALKQTSDSGTKIYFIAGNRDFLVGPDFAARTGIKILKDQTILEIDQQRIMIAHGDQFCIDDVDYIQARAEFMKPSWQQAYLSQSIQERKTVALELRALSEQKKRQKSEEIMDVNPDEIKRILQEHELDILIHGHTHRPYVHKIEHQGKSYRRYVLGEWTTERSVIYGNSGKYYLKK